MSLNRWLLQNRLQAFDGIIDEFVAMTSITTSPWYLPENVRETITVCYVDEVQNTLAYLMKTTHNAYVIDYFPI